MNQGAIAGLFFGTVEGLVLGLVPLILGMKKNQPGLAIGGFFACLIAGAAGGFILGIPCSAIFWWLVKKANNKSDEYKD